MSYKLSVASYLEKKIKKMYGKLLVILLYFNYALIYEILLYRVVDFCFGYILVFFL
jgi:hypothetical protein